MPSSRPPLWLGLQARVTVLTVLGLAVTFAVMGFIGLRAQATSVKVALEQRLALAETVAAHVDYHIGYLLAELATEAGKPGFDPSDGDHEPERAVLEDLYRSGMLTYDVFVTDADGIVLVVEPDIPGVVGANFFEHPHIRGALESGQPQVSGVIPGVAVPGPLVSLVVPVKNVRGELIGLIGGALDPSGTAISGFIGPMALGETGYAQVVDGRGMVIASTIPGAAGVPSEHGDLILSLLQGGVPALAPEALVTEGGREFYEVVAFAPIPSLGWGVTVEQRRAETLAPLDRVRTQTILAAALSLALAVVFVHFTTRQVTRRVLAIAAAARRVAGGDLDTPLPAFDNDEVGQLGRDFETMRARLRASRELMLGWNAELERNVAERTRELVSLQAASRRLITDLSLEATLEAMVEESQRLFGAERCAVFVLDATAEKPRCLIRHRLSADYVEAVCQNYKHLAGGVALATAGPVVVADAPTDPRMAPIADLVRQEGFRTILILPFVHRGQVAGAFALYHDRPREYTPGEIALGEAFAAQAANAVANAQLYQERQRRLAELTALFEVSSALRPAASVDEMLPIILEETVRVIGAQTGAIFLKEAESSELVGRVFFPPERPWAAVRHRPGDGITGHVALTGRIHVSPELWQDPLARIPPEEAHTLDGIRSSVAVPLKVGEAVIGVMHISTLESRSFDETRLRLLTAIADMAAGAIHRTGLHDKTVSQACELADLVAELEQTYDATLAALSAALDVRDHETEGHALRVTWLAVAVARRMGLSDPAVEALRRGALLHDLGKIGVPDRILHKPGPLTDEERARIQCHPQLGYEILKEIKFLTLALPVVLCHHERWDGTGYPQGLRGEAIPLAARIFAVADAYDAMTSDRPYRPAMSGAAALAEIRREAGKQFDPQVVAVFLTIIDGDGLGNVHVSTNHTSINRSRHLIDPASRLTS